MIWFKIKGATRSVGIKNTIESERILNQMKTKGYIVGKQSVYNLVSEEGLHFLEKEIKLQMRCWK